MNRIVSLGILTVLFSVAAFAADDLPAPEVDPGTATVAFVLVAGGLAIFRARRKR